MPTGWPWQAGAVVLEIADFAIQPGQEDGFVAAYRRAAELVAVTPGCRSMRMTRSIETPSRFVLLVEWDDVEAHTEGFRGSDRFPTWREHISPYLAAPPHVEHAVDVAAPDPADGS